MFMFIYSHSFGFCKRDHPFTYFNLFLSLATIIFTAVLGIGCKKNDTPQPPPIAPTVTTTVLSNITSNGATSGGTIVSDGGANVIQSGIVWSKTNTTPTLDDSVIQAGHTSIGPFTTVITGLNFNTTYYIRAFATNSVGTGFGEVLLLNTVNDTSKVRFMYNGHEVVYGVIISPTTGRKWLDRNLGAKREAASFNDYEAYGDLFQWGRLDDGHQLMNWTSSTAGSAANGMTDVLATSDIPGHNNFINASASSGADWRDDDNKNRWNTASQGPCPAGWHVPSDSEWAAETSDTQSGGTASSGGMTSRHTAYDLLKLSTAGYRRGYGSSAGQLNRTGDLGFYWSSTSLAGTTPGSRILQLGSDYVQIPPNVNSVGACVRCIKD